MQPQRGYVDWSHRVCDSKNLTQRDCYLGLGAQLGPQGKKGGKQEEQKQALIQHLQWARPFASRIFLNATVTPLLPPSAMKDIPPPAPPPLAQTAVGPGSFQQGHLQPYLKLTTAHHERD